VAWFADLLEETGLSGLLADGQWKTLKNGKRIKLDAGGRIVAGLPSKYHGIHVGDFGRMSKQERELLAIDCDELAACHDCATTYKTKDHAYRAILEANPRLDELRTSEFGRYDLELLKWIRNKRRGPKPRTKITDGRLDAINEFYDLKGNRRVASFTEAILYTLPASRKWKDLEKRLPPLEEAAGFPIRLPDEALKLSARDADTEQCRADVDARLSRLFEKAKDGRLEGAGGDELEEAPF
jgi:hypothetical protein